MPDTSNADDKRKLWDLIKSIRFAMMTTDDPEIGLRSRPMASHQSAFDGDLWFFTKSDTHKSREIALRPAVNLAYADPQNQTYVSVSGTADLSTDRSKAQELWNEGLRTWFPKGLDDPDLALIRVHVEHAEYWDAAASRMAYVYGYVKSRLSGKTPSLAEDKKIDF